jgi:hypothetical protein
VSGATRIDDRRWEQIRRIRERRQRLAAARAAQAAADWRQRVGEAMKQEAAVRVQAEARQQHAASRPTASGVSAADWRDRHQWLGELQRRLDDGRRLALLAHAEAMHAQAAARVAQTSARRAAQAHDRAQQAIERAQAAMHARAEATEEQQAEELAPQRWWRALER